MNIVERISALDIHDTWAGDSTVGLLKAKARALAMLGEFPEFVGSVESDVAAYQNTLPCLDDLEYEMPGADTWAAAGIAALLQLNDSNAGRVERIATQALAHASRVLMHGTGQDQGLVQGGADEQARQRQQLEENRQRAEDGKAAKSARMRRQVELRYREIIKANPSILQRVAESQIAESLKCSLSSINTYCRELGLLKRNRKNLNS